jgi:hypothetical protein
MDQIPKPIKRSLRQLADRAYEVELGRELTTLEGEFARWHRGELSPFDVAEAIHRFHQGPARDLYVSYTSRHPKAAVAYAIQNGILDRTQIAPDVLAELAGALSLYEASDSAQ